MFVKPDYLQNNPIKKVFETEWFSIDAIPYESANTKPYYRLSCGDAVSIVAKTIDEKIILVRQYRPAIEIYTLELPSGYSDTKESPEDAIKRELKEETGFICDFVALIGSLRICPSRINNTLHVFFGENAKKVEVKDGIGEFEVVLVTQNEFEALIEKGEFAEASGIGIYLLAKLKGFL